MPNKSLECTHEKRNAGTGISARGAQRHRRAAWDMRVVHLRSEPLLKPLTGLASRSFCALVLMTFASGCTSIRGATDSHVRACRIKLGPAKVEVLDVWKHRSRALFTIGRQLNSESQAITLEDWQLEHPRGGPGELKGTTALFKLSEVSLAVCYSGCGTSIYWLRKVEHSRWIVEREDRAICVTP
jgi:hypothetical protein